MDSNGTEKAPKVASKPFMAVGPTLHYSHDNVRRCWLLAIFVYSVTCIFWSKVLSGFFRSFDFDTLVSPELWRLGRFVVGGVNIFEYPWQILVLGLLMGILAAAPVLVSQLMSFRHSLPFILAVVFLANLPGLGFSLVISCVAAACRPLRFRSRFIAIVLCTAPQLVYWGYFGAVRGADPIRWGFSFTPWICAWFVSLAITGLVLGVGHFTRYRPGLVWAFSCMVLVSAVVVFEVEIGFDELDYQLYVAKNNPEDVIELHEHSIAEALDETLTNPALKKYLADFFYPTEPIQRRKALKREVQVQLGYDRWPSWFIVPAELKYQAKKQWLLDKYDSFINQRPVSHRMPIALYYKALLSEYSPDIKAVGEMEVLRFYSDYPYERSSDIWRKLYSDFGKSPESIEARWRIAKHWAGEGEFDQANKLLKQAQTMIEHRLKLLGGQQRQSDTLLSPFRSPADSVITVFKLAELQRKVSQLRCLISSQNRGASEDSAKHLAKFVMLNPYAVDYEWHLSELLEQIGAESQLRDNILLAQAKLVPDKQLRGEKLGWLHKKFANSDGGMQALYELGLLKIGQWRRQGKSNLEQKKQYLAEARGILTSFISLYPDSYCVEQVKKNLDNLRTID